ncbi:hypothetical protein DL98DRAFT_594572 [Cadophora sp. DSE1049]|nr:hypothetical protein DL98DRAFT_594572 [Cadophora sp. DSE1049]
MAFSFGSPPSPTPAPLLAPPSDTAVFEAYPAAAAPTTSAFSSPFGTPTPAPSSTSALFSFGHSRLDPTPSPSSNSGFGSSSLFRSTTTTLSPSLFSNLSTQPLATTPSPASSSVQDSENLSVPMSDPSNSMMSRLGSTQSQDSANPFIFPIGTVKLLVTYKAKELVGYASADTLVLASPVWKNFLFPPWDDDPAPVGEVKEKQIDCTEDDGEALLVLLNIVHLNFNAVPSTLEYSTLLQVAVRVDQYDCIKIVRPWLESWMKHEHGESLKPNQEGWLFIAWVFEPENIFEKLAKHLVVNSNVTSASMSGSSPPQNLHPPNGKPLASTMPPGIVESILKCRNKLLGDLLEIPYDWLSSLEKAMRSSSTICTVNSQSKVCDAAVYGSLIRGLLDASLYPRRIRGSLIKSVKSIADALGRIKLLHIKPEAPPVTPRFSGWTSASQRPTVTASPPGGIFGSQSPRTPCDIFAGLPVQAAASPNIFAAPAVQTTASGIEDHAVSAAGFSGPVAKILAAVPNPVLDSHRVHMRLQRDEALQ